MKIASTLIRTFLVSSLAISPLALTSCGSSKPTPRKTYSSTRATYKPQVIIRNNSRRNVVLGLRGPETRFIAIPARSSRSVNLSSGAYKWVAKAKKTNTQSGYKYFGTNKRYTWNFSIN